MQGYVTSGLVPRAFLSLNVVGVRYRGQEMQELKRYSCLECLRHSGTRYFIEVEVYFFAAFPMYLCNIE
jgi:hypothetical protein